MFDFEKNEWAYKPKTEKETGYEDIIDSLNIISVDDFCALTETEQAEKVAEVLKIIRSRNIFPIYYFNEKGIIKEIKKVINKNDVAFKDGQLVTQSSQGLLLLDYLFPNLHFAEAGNAVNNCMYNRFYDDAKLSKCLTRFMKNYRFTNMRTPFFMYGRFFWNTATNFAPIRAKAIAEEFCPAGGTIYDYSAGYGGRMLGILSSKKNFKYLACEPCVATCRNLNQLGKYIEKVTKRKDSYHIYNSCSEDLHIEPESVDFAFSCPPFYGLERYSDEPTQSINRFPDYEDWLNGYVKTTLQNCYDGLKHGGLFGVDIYDVFWKNVKYPLVDDWKRLAAEVGLIYVDSYPIVSRNRKDTTDINRIECVHLFKKE